MRWSQAPSFDGRALPDLSGWVGGEGDHNWKDADDQVGKEGRKKRRKEGRKEGGKERRKKTKDGGMDQGRTDGKGGFKIIFGLREENL